MTTEKKPKASTESIVQEIKRRIRRKFTAEEKIRIVLEGLRGDESITDLCRRKESIPPCTTNGVKPFWWRITKDFYNKKRQEYRIKQEEIQKKTSNLQKTDEEYYITASYILSLANHAYSLFMSSEREVKRQLLILLLQNCEIDHGSLRYTLNYPFSAIFSYTKSHNWLLG